MPLLDVQDREPILDRDRFERRKDLPSISTSPEEQLLAGKAERLLNQFVGQSMDRMS